MNHDAVQCPLCQGKGEMKWEQLRERVSDAALVDTLRRYVEGVAEEPAAVGAVAAPRNFEQDAHSWDPRLPMWLRSAKE